MRHPENGCRLWLIQRKLFNFPQIVQIVDLDQLFGYAVKVFSNIKAALYRIITASQ